jgi:hypothetical protein
MLAVDEAPDVERRVIGNVTALDHRQHAPGMC